MPKVVPECFNFTSWRIRLPHLKQFRKEEIDGTVEKVQSLKENSTILELTAYGLSHFSCTQLCLTPWSIALQGPLSMGLSRQEHWNGLPFSSPGDLPDPGIKPTSLMSPALAGRFFTINATVDLKLTSLHLWIYGYWLTKNIFFHKMLDVNINNI